MIADDLQFKKPDFLFIDINKSNIAIDGQEFYLDYLNYFLENHKFKQQWQFYRYFTTLEEDSPLIGYYKLKVFKRIAS